MSNSLYYHFSLHLHNGLIYEDERVSFLPSFLIKCSSCCLVFFSVSPNKCRPYRIVFLAIVQKSTGFYQWPTHTRCVGCVSAHCENANCVVYEFSNLRFKTCVSIILIFHESLHKSTLNYSTF